MVLIDIYFTYSVLGNLTEQLLSTMYGTQRCNVNAIRRFGKMLGVRRVYNLKELTAVERNRLKTRHQGTETNIFSKLTSRCRDSTCVLLSCNSTLLTIAGYTFNAALFPISDIIIRYQ